MRNALRALKRTAVLACAHGASVRRPAVLACTQCASRTETPSNGLRKYHRRERHGPQSRGLLKFNNRFPLCQTSCSYNVCKWQPCSIYKTNRIRKAPSILENIMHLAALAVLLSSELTEYCQCVVSPYYIGPFIVGPTFLSSNVALFAHFKCTWHANYLRS